MTFTIDESVIALWPWAAGVAYFIFVLLAARHQWRTTSHWGEFWKDDRVALTLACVLLWPVFVAFWPSLTGTAIDRLHLCPLD
jgi:hypothetical protein